MRVLIVGAGALGSVFGGLLRAKGYEVGLLEPSSRLDDVKELGLTVSGLFGEKHATGFSLYSSHEHVPAGYYDLALFTVKSFDTKTAAEQVGSKLGENAVAVSLQNGVGNYEAIRDQVGERRALAGRVIFGARLVDGAHAQVTVYAEPVMVGSPTNAAPPKKIAEIARAFNEAGIPTEATSEISKYIWAKMLYNCALNPLSALLNVPYGKLLESEDTRKLMSVVVEEVFAVTAAHEIALFWSEPRQYVEMLFDRLIPDTAAHFASMAQDLQAGRRTEIDAINGAVVQLAESADVPCPANATLAAIVRAAEQLR